MKENNQKRFLTNLKNLFYKWLFLLRQNSVKNTCKTNNTEILFYLYNLLQNPRKKYDILRELKKTFSICDLKNLIYGGKFIYNSKNDYYKGLDNKSGNDLLIALLDLQKQKTKLIHNAYSRLSDFYNKSKAFKDFYYEKNGYILDVYSENPDGKDPYNYEVFKGNFAKKEGEGLNKEHIIPQNWFLRQNACF
ncbi:endonuclease [Mycoplasmopsis cynos]|uniref:endonuclease n=1 Tax=Mycoplasmopsis cynos TaxID=171284 RepID=UPI00254093AC|nr:endonuclease [Mycoplasmopsis cynos]MCU9935516.1 endonuclease [Mycoplasmopsis cynos]